MLRIWYGNPYWQTASELKPTEETDSMAAGKQNNKEKLTTTKKLGCNSEPDM